MIARDNKKRRAGHYVQQLAGYKAFIPKTLPPNPPITMSKEMWSVLSKADRALGRLDGSVATLPNPDLFVFMYVRKEAVLSSQIEGTQASLTEVLELEAKIIEPKKAGDAGEVVNYIAAMNYGLERLKTLPLSLRLIREIHKRLLKEVRGARRNPGEFRTSQNWVGPAGCNLGEALYVPPPVREMKFALGELEKFLHTDVHMPALIKIGLVHGQFETIHPFLDGNGRVGRLLITFSLCREGILARPLLYLSHYFKRYRNEYYDRLQAIRDKGEWEEWLLFFLNGICEVSREAAETSRKIISMREDHRRNIMEKFGTRSGNAINLLEHLYWNPIISVSSVMGITKLTYANANKLVRKFEAMELLTELTGKRRNRKFSYKPYLDLFRE
ncbi:MAG: Fic family protein [Candidatus Tritonobacter lacicola]|nr:Fic family protein [Candidatus Tritonobacter lacicola]